MGRLKTILLTAAFALSAGYAVHLGGCNVEKATNYGREVCARTKQAWGAAEVAYNKAEPVVKEAYDEAEPVVRPLIEKGIDYVQEELAKDKEKDDEEDSKKTLATTVVVKRQ